MAEGDEDTLAEFGDRKVTRGEARKFGVGGLLVTALLTTSTGTAFLNGFDIMGKQADKARIVGLEKDKAKAEEAYASLLREWSYCMKNAGAPLSPSVGEVVE